MNYTSLSDSPGVPLLPPIAFALCLGMGVLVDSFFPTPLAHHFIFARIFFGSVACLGGGWILTLGFRLFVQAKTDPLTTRPASTLVTTGIYRRSRNPMYIGEIAILVGIGILSNSWWILAGSGVFCCYLRYYVIRREEAYLLRRFGDAYGLYCRTVYRWWTLSRLR
ncbi:MAG: isoprenylcysteine carboxylmethyltransferase family protein [Desulfovibrionales bacterium]|nr:isoprenylcysteine carboxylmethyltransferase family protein [Desulfovibrionales bacterium]